MKKHCKNIQILIATTFLSFSLNALWAAEKNILLIVTDDQSPTLGCYGNPVIQTPNLDMLAKDGTRFTHAFCTTASCSASRSVILTGLHNHANGQYGHQHHFHKFSSYPWVQSLPVLLDNLGYRTALFGKFHVAPEEIYRFEKMHIEHKRNPVGLAEKCRDVISEESDKPFFIYYATADPHRSSDHDESNPYKPNRFGNKRKKQKEEEVIVYNPKDVIVPPFLPDTPGCRAELAEYYQAVSRIDKGVGRLIEILKESGKWDKTLVIFTADHGMAFAGAKTTAYEGGLRVPFIVRNPYQKIRGNTNDAMISFIDITPTLLDFSGGLDRKNNATKKHLVNYGHHEDKKIKGKPYTFHGRSFLSIIKENHPVGWDEITASHTFHEINMYYPMRVIRDRKYKLIWNLAHQLPFPIAFTHWASPTWKEQFKQGRNTSYGKMTVGKYIYRPAFELFNIESDPYEGNNLAENPKYQELLIEYKAKLKTSQKKYQDPWILHWEVEKELEALRD